jgi:hypothetical protein
MQKRQWYTEADIHLLYAAKEKQLTVSRFKAMLMEI